MKTTTTVTLVSGREGVDNLVIRNITTYRVGNKLIWLEYNDGESIIAVKRSDYVQMFVDEHSEVAVTDSTFERINCESYSNC